MPLRLMQIFVPERQSDEIDRILDDLDVIGRWRDETEAGRNVINIVVEAEQAEPVMDKLENGFGTNGALRVVLYPVEAVLPRPDKEPSEKPATSDEEDAASKARVSREELFHDVSETLGPDRVFLAMTFLSAVVAAVGLLRNDVAVVIGAMVIAPLLGPNVALALATTLGDMKLLRRALLTNVIGTVIVLALSVLIGFASGAHADVDAIAARTRVDWADIVLALAAGSAGTFAFTRGLSGAVIGVMVAVALVPPLVVAGMLLGGGEFAAAFGAAILTAVNVICINLSGVGTFLLQGVRPRTWYEETIAKRNIIIAVTIWILLLAVLAVILLTTHIGEVRGV